ncbi:sensor histidine kinase [Paenibacillus soyae]|uniref:histidine kinase n=1 Tax=Paenibacillus soyae TaxID=2969249 RepID=A0A9X2MY18_9BACL|nr:HAMP domain-containing sensor histidine kinase [Paenibacillus soyae]MCR2807946.1 HAMP domain-containing histidine kinase [Paenibacillus soyae]
MSIRLRLTLWYSGLLAVTLLAFGISVYVFLNWNTYEDLRDQIKVQSDQLNVSSTFWVNGNFLDLDIDRQSRIVDKDMYVQLINYREGGIKQSTNLFQQNALISYPESGENPIAEFKKQTLTIGKTKYDILTYQRPLAQNGELVGLLQVGALTYNEDKYLAGLRTTLIFYSILVVGIAFTIGMLIARQALRPIGQVIDATRQIENGSDLSVRIPYNGPKDEIGQLANTLNSMLSRLERAYNELDEAYKAQRRFVSDASHELRTPLTTIRGNIDLLEKMWSRAEEDGRGSDVPGGLMLTTDHWQMSSEAMSDIAAEAKRMSTLVGDLLALARADAGYAMEKRILPLLPLTEEVVRRSQLLPRTAEWRVGDLSALRDIHVYGNHDYLQQLLFIFIENAFKYTPSGYVELSSARGDGHIGWKIKDTGIGMNPDEIPHIFDRFYRADESRGVTVGTGLGLSIAKWILDEHGGSVEVVTRENEGSTFTIWLPIDFSARVDSTIMGEADSLEE